MKYFCAVLLQGGGPATMQFLVGKVGKEASLEDVVNVQKADGGSITLLEPLLIQRTIMMNEKREMVFQHQGIQDPLFPIRRELVAQVQLSSFHLYRFLDERDPDDNYQIEVYEKTLQQGFAKKAGLKLAET